METREEYEAVKIEYERITQEIENLRLEKDTNRNYLLSNEETANAINTLNNKFAEMGVPFNGDTLLDEYYESQVNILRDIGRGVKERYEYLRGIYGD